MKAVPGLIDNTEDAVDGLLVDYTEDQKIVTCENGQCTSKSSFLGHCYRRAGCPTSVLADKIQ